MQVDVDDFGLDVTEIDRQAVVSLSGELDLATAPRLRLVLLQLAERGVQTVTVDLSGVSFIDSSGLGTFVAARKRLRQGGGDLVLHAPRPAAMRTFALTGLTKLFVITTS